MQREADRAEKEASMKAWRLERLGGELSFEDVRVPAEAAERLWALSERLTGSAIAGSSSP
jgi:hypothetical protein